jgi:hypothetical protein
VVPGLPPGTPAGTAVTAEYGGDGVYAASSSQPLATPATASVAPPVISGLRQSHLRWRTGAQPAKVARAAARDPGRSGVGARHGVATPLRSSRAPTGTTFRFSLSAPAALRLAFRLRVDGRSTGGRCVAATRGNRGARPCRRWVAAGAFTLSGAHAGANTVAFSGVLSRSRRLAPGLYRLVLSAHNAGGSSAPVPLVFRIVRR